MHYHIHKKLQDAAIWTWPSSKGQHRTRPRFWCREYLGKITKRYWQFLQSYCVHKAAWPWDSLKVQICHTKVNVYSYNMMQANSDALSYSQEAARCCHLNMTYFKRSKSSDKGQYWTHPRFWCGEYFCKITKWYWQFLQSYRVHKAAWPWASLKVQKGHTKVNVEFIQDFYVENIHVKLHDTGNLRKVIAFTKSSQMLPSWKFIKVTQRSRSNLVEILMSRA